LENTRIGNNIFHRDVIDAMFRQVRSKETIPFKSHFLDNELIIQAVDFDLGRQGLAYYDRDTASYHYTPGVNTRGNRGRAYRNDGVDIYQDDEGYHLSSIEEGEWLQYTINVKEKGEYRISLIAASDSTTGSVVMLNGEKPIGTIDIQENGGDARWAETKAFPVRLDAGWNRIRIRAEKGGFRLKQIRIRKK
jgi:hypothetical protein